MRFLSAQVGPCKAVSGAAEGGEGLRGPSWVSESAPKSGRTDLQHARRTTATEQVRQELARLVGLLWPVAYLVVGEVKRGEAVAEAIDNGRGASALDLVAREIEAAQLEVARLHVLA